MLRWTMWMRQARLFSQNDMLSFNAIVFRVRLNFKFITIIVKSKVTLDVSFQVVYIN